MRDGGRGLLEKYFSVFTCCSRSVFLYLHGVLEGVTPNLSRPLRTGVVMIDEAPENIARYDHSPGDEITEAEETDHDGKINESTEADETAAHRPPLHQERDHRGKTGVGTPIRVGETIEKDAVETETSGGRGVDHKGQHLPGLFAHLEEQDGNEVVMSLRAREHHHVHPGPLLASNDAFTPANTAISNMIPRANPRRQTRRRGRTEKDRQNPKRGSRARSRSAQAARRAKSSWTKMPWTSGRGQRTATPPTSREADHPSGTENTKWEGAATPWSQGLSTRFRRRPFCKSTSTKSSIREWRNVVG